MNALTQFLVLLTVSAYVVAVPVTTRDPAQCAVYCSGYTKYKYAPGTTYVFDYSATTTTEVAGATEQSAKLKLEAKAEIEVLSTCEFALSLNGVQLSHSDKYGRLKKPDGEDTFRRSLEKSVLRFSFDDGIVHQVCPEPGDPTWATNVKRGILSVFQNGMVDWSKNENRTETDVAGVCKTKYRVDSLGYFTNVVKREKDILSCTDRLDLHTMYQLIPYDINSDIQSMPIMKTSHECEYSIQTKGLLSSSQCKEVHVYRPFSNGNYGGTTTVDQVLSYYTERRGIKTRLTDVPLRSSLLYEHQTTVPDPGKALQMAETKLAALCDVTIYDVRPDTPRMFAEMVSSIRLLQHTELETLYRRLKSKTMCSQNPRGMKFFVDAVSMAPTGPSIRVMASMIDNGEMEGAKAKAWLRSLSLIKAPTSDMLTEALTLIDRPKIRQDGILPVSSLLYNFCKHKPSLGCDDLPVVDAIMTSLMKGHNVYCDTRGDRIKQVILLIRGLGNAGRHTKSTPVLNKCMTSRFNSLEVKVTAAEAFRRMSCDADDTMLWKALSTKENDSELRITAYLSLMRCPHENLHRLITILNNEENDHVGSFMYSHMTNLKESSNPHNQDMAEAISRLKFTKEFDTNPMKKSINFEKSVLINKLNTGFTSDSNVIWSDNTDLPHTIATNFSVELFGNSVNLFDVGARVEGFKHLLGDAIFGGRKGDSKKMFQMFIYGRVFGNEVGFQRIQQQDILPEEAPYSNWMDTIIKMADNNDFSYTQSLQFLDTRMVIPTSAGFPLTVCVNGTAVLDVVIKGKVDLRKVAAKPRSLKVDGEISPSAAIEMNSVMMVEVDDTAQTALRMKNTMHTSTGIKGRVNLDRGQQLNIEMDSHRPKTEIFEAKSEFFILYNNEVKEQKMITDNRQELKLCTGDRMSTITGVEICGEASFPNASMHSEGPYFPLTGPATVKVVMTKRDTHSTYKLFIKRIENKKSSSAQIFFNTPGSETDRKMLLDVGLDYPKKEIEIKAHSPWKKATFKGTVLNTDSLKSVAGNLVIDATSTYGLVSEVKVATSKAVTTLTPKLEIQRPKKDKIVLSGVVKHDKNYRGIESDMSLVGLYKSPCVFKGKMNNKKKEKSLTLSFTPPDAKADYAFETTNLMTDLGKRGMSVRSKVDLRTPVRNMVSASGTVDARTGKTLRMFGSVDVYRVLRKSTMTVSIGKISRKGTTRYNYNVRMKSPKVSGRLQGQTSNKGTKFVASKMTLDYTIPRVSQNKIAMNTKFSDRSTKSYSKYNLRSGITFKKSPQYNMGLQAALDFKKKIASSSLDIKYGANPKNKNKRILWSGTLKKNVKSWNSAVVDYKMKAEAPELNVNLNMNGKHAHTPRMLNSAMQMDYDKGKTMKMGITLKDQSTKRKKMNGVTYIDLPGYKYTLSSSLVGNSPTQTTHSITLTDKRGANNQIDTVINVPRNKPRSFVSNIKLDGMKAISVSGSASLDPKNVNVNGEFKYAKDIYKITTNGKYVPKLNRGKFTFDLLYPSRKVKVTVDGGADNVKYDASIGVDWDANRKAKSKISVEMSHLHKSTDDSRSLASLLQINTPFKNYENIGASFKYLSDASNSDILAQASAGSKAKQISSYINIKKPFNIYSAVATTFTKTPFKGYQLVQLEINHKIDPALSTILKSVLEKHTAELMLSGENKGDNYRTDLKGNLALKSTVPSLESVTMTMSHAGNSRIYWTNWVLVHNGDKYTYTMNIDHSTSGWNIRNKGDVAITTPKQKMSTVWKHKNGDRDIDTSFASEWDDKVVDVKISGAFENKQTKTLDANLKVRSPWQIVKDLNFKLNGKQDYGSLSSKAMWHRNGKMEANSEVNFVNKDNVVNFDTILTSPFHEDITGKINFSNRRYPMTGFVMMQWSPQSKATVMGSAITKTWDDAEIDVKVTTPHMSYKNVVWKASSKMINGEYVVQTGIDTGVRQWMNIDTRFRTDHIKMAKFKMTTPFEDVQSVDTGFRIKGDLSDFTAEAEFETVPHLNKISGKLILKNQDTFTSTFFLFTPFPVIPSFETSVLYEQIATQHMARLNIDYPDKITATIESSIKTDLPIIINTKITSTIPSFNHVGFSLQHGHTDTKINSHVEVVFKPGKKMEGDLIGSWVSDIEGSVMLKTPFRELRMAKAAIRHRGTMKLFNSHGEMSMNNHRMEIDGSFKSGYTTTGAVALSSSIPGLANIDWTIKKRGPIRNMRLNSIFRRNGKESSLAINNKYVKNSLTSLISFSSPYTETTKVEIKHKITLDTFTEKVTVTYGRSISFDGVANFNMDADVVAGNTAVRYKQGRTREVIGFSFKKSGTMNALQFETEANRNRNLFKIKGSWNYDRETKGSLEIQTPVENYKNLALKMAHEGDIHDFKTTSTITYMDDQTVDANIEFAHGNGRRIRVISDITTPIPGYESLNFKVTNNFDDYTTDIDGNAELTTTMNKFGFGSITYSKSGNMDNFVAKTEVKRNGKEVMTAMASTSSSRNTIRSDMSFKSSVTTDMNLIIEKVGNPQDFIRPRFSGLAKLSMTCVLDKDVYSISSQAMKKGEEISGTLDLQTPLYHYENLSLFFKHSGKFNNFKTEAVLKMSKQNVYSGKVSFFRYLFRRLETTFEIASPVKGFEITKFNYRHEGAKESFKCFSTLEYGNAKKIEYEMQAISSPNPKFSLIVKTPFTNYEEIKSEIEYDISGPVFFVTSDVNAGNGYVFSLKSRLDTGDDIIGSVALTTPFRDYTDLSANFKHGGNMQKFDSNFVIVYTDRKTIRGKINFNGAQWRKTEINAELFTPFRDWQKNRISVKNSDKGNSMTSTASVEYGFRKKIDVTMNLIHNPSYDFKLDFRSPFKAYRTVKIASKGETSPSSFRGFYSVIVNRYDAYSTNINWNIKSWKIVNGMLLVNTPDMGMTKASYAHNIDDQNIDGTTSLEYNNGKIIKADVTMTLEASKEISISIKTPFTGYEALRSNLKYIDSYRKHFGEGRVDLGEENVYSLKSEVDYSTDQTMFLTSLTTPIQELKEIEIKMTHEGGLNDFNTYVYLYTPQTDKLEARGSLTYNGFFDSSLSANLKSAITEMDDMKLDIKTSDLAGEKKMTTAVQWTEGKMIMSSMLFRQRPNRWNGDKYHMDVSLATPFPQVESMSMQLDQLIKNKAYEEKFMMELNGEQLWDTDFKIEYDNDQPLMEMTVRQPWPMQMTAKTSLQDVKKEASLYLNWDRDDTESNVNIQASTSQTTAEQAFSLEVICPSRTVGVSHKAATARGMSTSEGKLYWNTDEDSRLSYNLERKESRRRGRMVNGMNVKVGLPGRTLSMEGTYSGYRTAHALDTTFSWDADKDTSKKIEMKASLTGITPRKGDITISLPSLNKEIKVEGEMTMMDGGRTILDARTDFSYSQDARKTLTLVSKFEDIKDYKSDFNYSLTLGIVHPYTRVDVQMTSHIGSSKEKITLGTDTMYLTARKQKKNMALFAEIDKIKKQVNVQMRNPLHQRRWSAKVLSDMPYKVQMANYLDGSTLMEWDVTVDSAKKAVLINTYYQPDGRVTISTMYPNSTSVVADITKHSPMAEDREVLIRLTLLSPYLLHTGVSWRPGAMQEVRSFSVDKFKMRVEDLLTKWKTVNTGVIEELSAKYSAIVNAVSEEVKPLLDDLQIELKNGDQQILNLIRKVDQIFRSDNVYKMGGQPALNFLTELTSTMFEMFTEYKSSHTRFLQSAYATMDQWKKYPMRDVYLTSLDERYENYRTQLNKATSDFEEYMGEWDTAIFNMRDRANEFMEKIRRNPYVVKFNKRMDQLDHMDMDITHYIPEIQIFYLPMTVANWTMDQMSSIDFSIITERPEVKHIHKGVNEVYQQGVWAYNYWEMEENGKKHFKSFLHEVKLIAQDELKEHVQPLQAMNKNPMTVWRPERGHIEMDIPLPLPVHRLDEMPDWGSYTDAMTIDFDLSIVKDLFKDIQDYIMPSTSVLKTTKSDDVIKPTPKYIPPRKTRRRGGRRPYPRLRF